ncbi:putative conserved transmembrane alanine rich protein [Mycobacterium ulcerans str. Harvey]|uniref:Conserved transmembrane alanine rich protein n=1 Tax=Mycobacterium ulcerans str. Harvey TaxID=1299332 RepID=A0ABP3AFX6_MYCUL|nr:putative conserved transmembrane alanine rich protein [Mycobacterium ulcerans str. Harvey]
MLAGGAALAALGVVVSACGESPPKRPAVEELLAPLEQARHDSALASAAAGRSAIHHRSPPP